MTRPDAMDTLRERTAAHHDRVERSVDLLRRCRTRAGYGGLLAAMRDLYEPLEWRLAEIDGLRAVLPDVAERMKSTALAQDLAALGAARASQPPARLVLPDGLDDALGCLYVLEGSTLGGALIARHIQATLGLESAFFTSYGPGRGVRWRAFGAALRAHAARGGDVERMVLAAEATFDAFAAHLVPSPAPEELAA